MLVTLAAGASLLDRRNIALSEPGLPSHPHHHEGSWAIGRYLDSPWARAITLPEAIALVERVQQSALQVTRKSLETLAASVGAPIASIALRQCPELPASIEQRIRDHRAQTFADSVMYRQALAQSATSLGWSVHWYDPARVLEGAARALELQDATDFLRTLGQAIGPPWRAEHRLAAAAAIAAAGSGL